MMASVYLSDRALGTLTRLGNILCPGSQRLPRFEASGCVVEVDGLLQASPEQDRTDLQTLLWCLSWMPDPVLRGLLGLSARWPTFPAPIQTPLRMLDLGLRGVVFSLYYSGLGAAGQPSGVHEGMTYEVQCDADNVPDQTHGKLELKSMRKPT